MAFKFKLQSLLNLKERKREEIQLLLTKKMQEYTKLLEELAEIKANKEKIQTTFQKRLKSGLNSNELIIALDEINYINRIENEKIKNINIVEKEINQIKKKLMEAHKEFKLLEKIKEREIEKYNIEETKKEQKQIDEIINIRYAKQS